MTTCASLPAPLGLVLRPTEDDVAIGGELALQSGLEQALRSAPSRLVVDLSAVRFLDAPGLRVLVEAAQSAAEQGAALHLAHCSPEVLRLLDAAGAAHLAAPTRAAPTPA